ncbi:hypothetical protein CRYUN_Cryun21dG0078200 [Craigia yunnanensis]
MNEEDRRAISSMLESQEECEMITPNEDNRIQDTIKNSAEQSPNKTCSMDAAENRGIESACSPLSACSEPQAPANVLSISVNERMDNCAISVHQLDSECSTTQAETSKEPG